MRKQTKILIADDMHPAIMDLLETEGFPVDYEPDITPEQLRNQIHLYRGLIIRSKIFIDRELLKKTENLDFIGRAGAGMDNIDVEAAKEMGIMLFNAPEGNRDAVGEHAIGMLLMMLNHLCKGHNEVTQRIWDREGNRGTELGELTVGILGYGNTGSAFARKLKGFGCQVLAYDKYTRDREDGYAERVSMNTLFQRTDVLSIHVPLTDETRGMINRDFLQAFLKPLYLINTSRGKVLKLADLLEVIENKKVKGAALDVLENEKMQKLSENEERTLQKLTDTGRTLFTPHVAGWTYSSYRKISQVLGRKIIAYYSR